MSTIAFALLPEAGHYYTVMGLAHKLKAVGHRIYFLGILDFQSMVVSQGFEFISFLEEVFPAGFIEAQATGSPGAEREGIFKTMKRESNRVRELNETWFKDAVYEKLKDIRPDLVLVDSYLAYLALVTFRYKIPSILISVTLPQYKEYGIPPITSTYIPKNKSGNRLRANLAWAGCYLRNYAGMRLASIFGIDLNYLRLMRRLAKFGGYPEKDIYPHNAFIPGLNLPELILCPRELDFPREANPHALYIESSLPAQKADESFPWDKINPDRPLVFCTLGSQSHQWRGSPRFFQMMIQLFAARPEWQLVLAIGQYINIEEFKTTAPNIIIVNWAPHAEVLKRTTLMVNHGGLGTVKECIYYDVPMISIPFMRDQPGNAARVAYHGLGILLPKSKLSRQNLEASIERILNEPAFSTNVKRMGARFREIEASDVGVQTIARFVNHQVA